MRQFTGQGIADVVPPQSCFDGAGHAKLRVDALRP